MGKTFRVVLWTVIVLGTLIGLARLTAIRWWRIPEEDVYLSASVAPTLRGGDLILLWRLTEPGVGDLVVCPDPKHAGEPLIGRLVGEEGDHLEIAGTLLTVNDELLKVEGDCAEEEFISADPQTGIKQKQTCDMEIVGGRTHPRGNAVGGVVPPTVQAKVPAGKVYLVSDNRQFPYDSRDVGPIDRAACTETVFFRLVGSEGYGDATTRFTFIK